MLVNGDIKRRGGVGRDHDGFVLLRLHLAILDGLLVAGVSLARVWEETAALVSDPEYRRKVRVVESALWGHPYLTGDEVVLLIAAS